MPPRIGSYLEQQILSATPLELVVLSYRTAIGAVRDARRAIADRDGKERVRSLNLAYGILGELYRTLDFKAGAEIARELGRLYEYMMHLLVSANSQKADAPLGEVLALLTDLTEAWEKIAAPAVSVPPRTASSPRLWEHAEAGLEHSYSASF